MLTKTKTHSSEAAIKTFIIISALIGLGMGLSESLLANYFKEAYEVNAQQRGFIEFPRELPGVISLFFIAGLSFLGNKKAAIIAQLLTAAGLAVLGFFRPSFAVMLVFLFIFSTGAHMYLALGDSIGLSLAKKHNMGLVMGKFNSARMAFLMLAGILSFVGFRWKWFSFDIPVAVFLISAAVFLLAGVFLVVLCKIDRGSEDERQKDLGFVFKKKYIRYYAICALFGGRKQIMFVYSPWVLIDLLNFKADTMSILAVLGSMIGIFFIPIVGKWIDKYGVKRVMTIESLAFIVIYIVYGLLSKWVNTHTVALSGLIMIFVYLLYLIDKMSSQFAMVRVIYMRSIAIVPEDITPSITLGMSIDHVVAIIGSYVCGVIWFLWGPEYVFLLAGILSLLNLIVANGIKPESAAQEGESLS